MNATKYRVKIVPVLNGGWKWNIQRIKYFRTGDHIYQDLDFYGIDDVSGFAMTKDAAIEQGAGKCKEMIEIENLESMAEYYYV